MKQIQHYFVFCTLLILLISVGCVPVTSSTENSLVGSTAVSPSTEGENGEPLGATHSVGEPVISEPEPTNDVPTAATRLAEESPNEEPQPTVEPTLTNEALPLLPPLLESNIDYSNSPLPPAEDDPFAAATFTLATSLPDEPATAVVQQHGFGVPDETQARLLADQLGFTSPLYVQKIAPEFAPPPGSESATIFTAFDGQRILNISDNGLNFEGRGVLIDYMHPLPFSEKAPLIKTQLEAWGLLDFPYEIRELPAGDLVIYRLIDGLAIEQNEFNFMVNETGEIAYFDYRPLREITVLGNYPLQSAAMAWQQLQTPEGRSTIRYELSQPPVIDKDDFENFVNPRSWSPYAQVGQEVHIYMTPAVYEATDGSGLRLLFGDLTLTGDGEELTKMATHLSDVLHVWGTIAIEDGVKTLAVSGWEQVNGIRYDSLEGTISYADGQVLLHTVDGETFIMAAPPQDIPDGLEGYVSVAARRDIGADYPVLDWTNITEKIAWPDVPLETAVAERSPITKITVNTTELIYFPLYQTVDVPGSDSSMLFEPVWKFSGETDQGDMVTFWVLAVAADYLTDK